MHLLFSILPTTLLLEAIHTPTLTRTRRIDYLLTGFSLIYTYYQFQKYAFSNLKQVTGNNISQFNKESAFTNTWCMEYISVVFGIVCLLATEEHLHLGALGSNMVEHYFGNIRRLSRGDDTHKKFLKSMKLMCMEDALYNELGMERSNPERRSSSGCKLEDELPNEDFYIYDYLTWARRFFNRFVLFKADLSSLGIPEIKGILTDKEIEEFLVDIKKEVKTIISTKSSKMTATGGEANRRMWKAAKELEDALE